MLHANGKALVKLNPRRRWVKSTHVMGDYQPQLIDRASGSQSPRLPLQHREA